MAKFKVGDKVTWKTITGGSRCGTVTMVQDGDGDGELQTTYTVAVETFDYDFGLLESELSKDEVLCPFNEMRPCTAGCSSMQERACVNGP
jgi:hypothetical protein